MSTLPATSGGSIANFLDGETVTYHLDGAGGAVLAGSITPSPVPVGGSATVSVTIPAGTLLGAHSVFAVGSLGSTASAAFTVIDNTPPVVSAAVINKTSGDRPGFVKQGGTYFVYANANDAAGTTGTHVVSTVTANVTNITTGSTAVALTTTGGPWTVGGVSYAYRSASLTASNPVVAGAKSFTVTATDASGNTGSFTGSVTMDNTVPTATTVQTTNAGTISRIGAGDTISYTFGEAMDPNSILAGWTGASIAVTVHLNNLATDTVTVFDSLDTTQVNLGSVNLARTDYFGANRTVPSTMVMSGTTITITFGTPSGGTTTAGGTATMVWSPSILATDLAGNAVPVTNVNENGTLDRDF
jgi:hypothetical protein